MPRFPAAAHRPHERRPLRPEDLVAIGCAIEIQKVGKERDLHAEPLHPVELVLTRHGRVLDHVEPRGRVGPIGRFDRIQRVVDRRIALAMDQDRPPGVLRRTAQSVIFDFGIVGLALFHAVQIGPGLRSRLGLVGAVRPEFHAIERKTAVGEPSRLRAGPQRGKGLAGFDEIRAQAGAHPHVERVGQFSKRMHPFRLDGAGLVQRRVAGGRRLSGVRDERLGDQFRRNGGNRDVEETEQRRLFVNQPVQLAVRPAPKWPPPEVPRHPARFWRAETLLYWRRRRVRSRTGRKSDARSRSHPDPSSTGRRPAAGCRKSRRNPLARRRLRRRRLQRGERICARRISCETNLSRRSANRADRTV